jgi:hypothetical protein
MSKMTDATLIERQRCIAIVQKYCPPTMPGSHLSVRDDGIARTARMIIKEIEQRPDYPPGYFDEDYCPMGHVHKVDPK